MISFVEVFRVALKSLMVNKTRSALTALGIIIGVAAVIAAFAVGAGANKSIDEEIASLGSNFMVVYTEYRAASSGGIIRFINLDDADAIRREISGVTAVAPVVSTKVKLVYGSNSWDTSLSGSTGAYTVIRDWKLQQGRDLQDADVRTAARVCVLGSKVADKLFDGADPLGKIVRINKLPFTVAGVLKSKGSSLGGDDQDDLVIVPVSTAKRSLVRYRGDPGRVSYILVKGISMKALSYMEVQINALLRERHRIRPGSPNDFAVNNISEYLEMRRKTTQIMSLLLGGVAGIALVVGGIGIMNIMLVSVTERTREIGIRMAIGAKSTDIRLQFLIEAVVLSLLGGTIGILVGIGAGYGLGRMTQAPPVFSMSSIVLACVFSAFVGVVFGFYPAWKASLLNPIDALKYE